MADQVSEMGPFQDARPVTASIGHSSTTTTETVYRKQIRPVPIDGADVMDRSFPAPDSRP